MPLATVSASLIASGSSESFSVLHSQKEAIRAALLTESLASVKPTSMIGISAAAARSRLISGVAGVICLDM